MRKSHSTNNSIDDEDIIIAEPALVLGSPPNGGMVAWLQVLAAFLGNMNSWGLVNAFGVYQEFYQNNLLKNETPFRISWINGLAGALVFFGTNFYGGFFDLGYMKHMALLALILQFAALMLLSWSKTYAEIILTQGLFSGVVSAMSFMISIGAVAPYFTTRRPLAIGLAAAGSSVGGTIYSVMARRLISLVGFGWSTRIIAFVQLGTAGVTFISLKRRLPPTKRKAFVAWECFREPPFMFYCIGNMCGMIGTYSFYTYFQSYAIDMNGNNTVFTYMTALINTGSVLGRVVPALIANTTGPLNVLIPSDIASVVLLFCWIRAKNSGGIISIGVLFGLTSGPLMGLPGAVVSELTHDFHRLGIRLSFLFAFMSFGIVIGPPISGIIDRKYGWLWVQIYVSLSYAVCLSCHFLARLTHSGLKLKHRV